MSNGQYGRWRDLADPGQGIKLQPTPSHPAPQEPSWSRRSSSRPSQAGRAAGALVTWWMNRAPGEAAAVRKRGPQRLQDRVMIRAVVFDIGECLVDETREYGTWADWLGVPRHTFAAMFGAVIAQGRDYRAGPSRALGNHPVEHRRGQGAAEVPSRVLGGTSGVHREVQRASALTVVAHPYSRSSSPARTAHAGTGPGLGVLP